MGKKLITAYCGDGRGKTSAAMGYALQRAEAGKTVTVIQFMKGCQEHDPDLDLIRRLEPEMKVFRFEKIARKYNELTEEEKKEEAGNIRNAFFFAKKVLTTGSCDLLVLDEILGLCDIGLVSVEEMMSLMAAKEESTEVVITGIHVKDALLQYIDRIYEIRTVKTEDAPEEEETIPLSPQDMPQDQTDALEQKLGDTLKDFGC